MTSAIDTDYLVVGAGAAGMAFTDELLAHSDATVTIVDRRHAPGGHWIDAYPYVRLHQPSAFYGVTSVPLGEGHIDVSGSNSGFYELASATELLGYYDRVMQRHFLPTGRVRYLPNTDHVADDRVVSRLTGASQRVRVRRKVVDTTYMEVAVPATTPPPFEVANGVRCVTAGAIARLEERADRFVIVGAGKTALDAAVWLLEGGAPPDAIRWVKPREAWWINRKFQQPHSLAPDFHLGTAMQLEAMAEARSVDDLFARLEASCLMLRVDESVSPTMFRGAILSERELALLRQIDDVVSLGHVRRVDRHEIVLDQGRVPTTARTVYVHCAARALARRPLRPIFEPGRVTLQPVMWGFACYQFALLGFVEATVDDDDEKNRLCEPMAYWDRAEDYLSSFLVALTSDYRWGSHPDLVRWSKTNRLNPTSGVAAYHDDPRVLATRERIKRSAPSAIANAQRLLAA